MNKHEPSTLQFIDLLKDPELKSLVEETIELSAKQNPDKATNPAQSLEELYDFLDWSVKCMPWNALNDGDYDSLYLDINQSINYF